MTPTLFKIRNTLGPLELQVMEIIWENKKVAVREVVETLRHKKPIAYTTIMTVMDNLYKKGFLTREKVKKSYYYFPVAKRSDLITNAISEAMKELTYYGRIKLLMIFAGAVLFALPNSRSLIISNKMFLTYKAPVGYGLSFTLILALLIFSTLDLLQNLKIFGTIDYLKFATSEPSIFVDRFWLFSLAFLESLPIGNILITATAFIFVIILMRKLSELLNLRVPVIKFRGALNG